MAKVKSPLLSLEAHGELGGVEYRQGIYGPMVGRRSIASMQATPLQLLHRSRLKLAHTAWLALFDSDRALWCAHATYPETGLNCFVGRWIKFTQAGFTPLTIPLPYIPQSPITNLIATVLVPGESQIALDWDYRALSEDLLLFYLYQSFSHRHSPTLSKMRYNSWNYSSTNFQYITPDTVTPVNHIRLDQVSLENGDVISRHLLHVLNPGS
jgi:hypothetical protein